MREAARRQYAMTAHGTTNPAEAPADLAYVVRFRAPQQGEIEIDDCVQGRSQ